MRTVSFQNEGYLDPVSIKTFGVNAKDSDNPIGYFGTGLKYAIAVLLREGCTIEILSGDDKHTFKREDKEIRGKQFSIVTMNGEPAGFTTELGKNWKVWQAFRELYCNALDEKGSLKKGRFRHAKNKTTVTVTGDSFYEAYQARNTIVLEGEPHIKNIDADIHIGGGHYIYYKSVRIYKSPRHLMHTYNISEGIDISEDRTAKYEFQLRSKIARSVVRLNDERIIESIVLAQNEYFEASLDFEDTLHMTPSDTFLRAAEENHLNPKLNISVRAVLHKHGKMPEPEPIELNDIQLKQLDKAKEFCGSIGYPVDRYPIVITDELKGGLMGLAKTKTIYLAQDSFGMGTKYVASTLIEEFLHLHTGYGDMTRELQNHLLNDLVSLGERVIGEPI